MKKARGLLKSEVPAARTHWAAQYVVLSRANSSAICALCVLVLRVPIALWRRDVPLQQPARRDSLEIVDDVADAPVGARHSHIVGAPYALVLRVSITLTAKHPFPAAC